MTLEEAVLQKLTDWRPADGRQTLIVADEGAGWTAAISADRSDALGCRVWEMTLRRGLPAAADDVAALHSWAERVTEQVKGLHEPLKVVEVDDTRGQALLRSQEPARRGGQLFYFEVILSGVRAAELRRYRAAFNGEARREQIAFVLTHETLARLSADLTANS